MIKRKSILDILLLLLLVTILVIPSWRLFVASNLQKGMLLTGLFQARPQPLEEVLNEADHQMLLEDVNGEIHSLKQWQGQVLFINFWASWCAPCLAEMPDINNLYLKTQHEPKIQFLMISTDQDWAKARQLVANKEFQFPIYRLRSDMAPTLSSASIPATFVVAPDGQIALKKQGMASYNHSSFLEFLKDLRNKN